VARLPLRTTGVLLLVAVLVPAAGGAGTKRLTPAGPRPSRPHGAVVRPERFGARGNGVHDDTAAVQAALRAAAGKAVVWLGAHRRYRCSAPIELPSNSTIEGAGADSVLSFTWVDATGPASRGNWYIGNDSPRSGTHDVTLVNFVVAGAGSGLPSGPGAFSPNGLAAGIALRGVDSFAVRHLTVRNVPGISILYKGSRHVRIEGNDVRNSGRDGISGFWSPGNLVDVDVTGNVVTRAGDDGIAVWGTLPSPQPVNDSALPTDIRITGNRILGWPSNPNGRALGRGIVLGAVTHVLVQHNAITRTYGAGVQVIGCTRGRCPPGAVDPASGAPWRSSDVRVLDNTITAAGRLRAGSTIDAAVGPQSHAGIALDSTDDSTVWGNVVTGSAGAAVEVGDCRRCRVQQR
jgi:hypothetical protein